MANDSLIELWDGLVVDGGKTIVDMLEAGVEGIDGEAVVVDNVGTAEHGQANLSECCRGEAGDGTGGDGVMRAEVDC